MSAQSLPGRPVERIWGRRDLPAGFGAPAGVAIGEIWFEEADPEAAALLVKYLFTAERLSIQVHPGDAAARAAGYPRGKDEAWYVLAAEADARIGLGLTREVTREELAAAARDGSIEALLDWRPAKAGDIFYSPAGTIHAIGGGLSLIEIQQNLDLTYRLYDYGRPRELHVDQAVAVAVPGPWTPQPAPRMLAPGRDLLAAGGAFTLERWRGDHQVRGNVILAPLAGGGTIDGAPLAAGTVWRVEGGARLVEVDALAAYAGADAVTMSS